MGITTTKTTHIGGDVIKPRVLSYVKSLCFDTEEEGQEADLFMSVGIYLAENYPDAIVVGTDFAYFGLEPGASLIVYLDNVDE